MIKIAHLALACLAANGAAQDAGHRKLPHIMTFDGAMEALREAYDTDGPDADPCDLFREPTCLRVHKKHGVKPDQPKWGPDRCTAENNKRDWVAVFCPGTGDADADEDAPFDAEAPVGNIQPVAVGPGQIIALPAPPPPPCDMAAWLATLDPSLGPGATTADVCRTRCGADAKDVSSMVPPFFSGAHDFYAVGGPVCIISTMVHASHIRTTPFDDCVFIACPRSNTVVTMEGDDIVYFREEVYNNRVALGPGRDRGIAHEGSTFAHYNKFKVSDSASFPNISELQVASTASSRRRTASTSSTLPHETS